jgi:FkbM family methyltransferase
MTTFNLIDIGSAGDVSEPWNSYPETVGHILKFEPRDADSTNEKITFLPHALWSTEEERPFYIYRGFNGTGSSLYKQNYHYVAANFPSLKARGATELANTWFERSGEIKRTVLKCRTLDSVLAEQEAKGKGRVYQFLKVDAQGADLDILAGATNYLRSQCLGVQCELFTLPLYEGIKLIDEATQWLKDLGFDLVIKHEAHGTFLSQHDCVFLKRGANTSELREILNRPPLKKNLTERVVNRLKRVLDNRSSSSN